VWILKSIKISDLENVCGSTSPYAETLCSDREYTTTQNLSKSSGVIMRKIVGIPNYIKKKK
jgi:hypothetical protein